MKTTELRPLRLLLESLLIIGLTEAFIMTLLPWMVPTASEVVRTLLDIVLLTVIAAPMLLWRFSRSIGLVPLDDLIASRVAAGSRTWPLVVAAVGMLATGVASYLTYSRVQTEAHERFTGLVTRLESDVRVQFALPLEGINGMAGFFNAVPTMNRKAFELYWAGRDFSREFPGVHSMGAVQPVPRADLAKFETAQRRDGAPDFKVKTQGNHPQMYVVKYIASDSKANAAVAAAVVLGADAYTDPVRRAVLEQSVRSGQLTLSGVINLMPREGVNQQGLHYVMPLYQRNAPVATPEQRERALATVVYASLVIGDLMAYPASNTDGLLAFELRDATDVPADTALAPVLYRSQAQASSHLKEERTLALGGRSYVLHVQSSPAFESTLEASLHWVVGAVGLLLTLLLATSVGLLSRGMLGAQSMARALREQSSKLIKAVQLTNNSVVIGDADNKIEWANDAFSRISGVAMADALGKNVADVRGTHITDPEAVARMREAFSRGEDARIQVFNRSPQGQAYWLDTDMQVLHAEDGRYAGYLAVETDITAAKVSTAKLNAALMETQALMDTINVHAIVSETDGQGTIQRVNDNFCRLSGYTEDELIGANHRIVNSGVHPARFWKELWTVIGSGLPWRGQICNKAKDGSLYWVDSMIAPFIGDDGKIEKYISIRLDITDSKRDQDALRRNALLLEESQSIAKVGGWEFDLVQGKLYWTAETYRIHETTPEEFDPTVDAGVGYFLPESQVRITQALEAATLRGEAYDLELETFTTKGRKIHVRTTCIATMEDGKPIKLSGIFQDITERKEYEASLKEARQRAEQATQSKAQFLANMSHEIRTPMNAIMGMLQLVQTTDLNVRQQDYVSKADGAAKSLLGLINDILDFSKVEAGKMELDMQPMRFSALLRDLSVILSANLKSKGVEVLYDIDPALPAVVLADAMRLQQVLINLGGNAVKFTPAGQVIIALRLQQQNAQNVRVEFSVKDSGIGIAPENQVHIFSGFSQAEASTSRKFGGTGLGLAISQRLVHMMGGELTLKSNLGLGSTFSFTVDLPLASTGSEGLLQPVQPSVPPRRVLVIDDNETAARLMAQMTRAWSWPTEVVFSGEDAKDLIRSRQMPGEFAFDVVYVDWQMSGMDGWEVTHWIRQHCVAQGVRQPVIVMTSASNRETLAQRTQEEQDMLNAFLVKPITASMLQEAALSSVSSEFRLRQAKRAGSSHRRLAGLRILVVEDNLINQQVAEELLMSEGATVSLAANGRLGVNAVAAASPQFDVVLMDIQMPVMDGFAATTMIRTQLGLTQLPIVAMTANALASDREASLAVGMNEHVGKPFDLAQLVRLLLKVTGRQDAVVAGAAMEAPSSEPIKAKGLDTEGALARLGGLKSLYLRSLRDFAKVLPQMHSEFVRLLSNDLPKATIQIHTVRGTAATLGASRLAECATHLERLCKRGDAAAITASDLDQLGQAVQETQDATAGVIAQLDEGALPVVSAESGAALASLSPSALAALQALAALLKADDMVALEKFAEVRSAMPGVTGPDMDALEQAMQNLDFSAGLAACRSLLSSAAPDAAPPVS